MSILSRLIRSIIVSLSALTIFNVLIVAPVFAKDIAPGFAAGTMISTPQGDIAVENLVKGDRIIGYNFETHQSEENIISEIKSKSSLSYYLVNDRTKITGTSSIFVKTQNNPTLSTIQQLKLQEELFSKDHASINLQSLRQIVKPTEIYQISLENPIGNLFADNLLIHDGKQLSKVFRKQYINCDSQSIFFDSYNKTGCEKINSDNLDDFIKALAILLVGIVFFGTIIAKLLLYIPNLIKFSGKQFTNNIKLIEFTKGINPNFANRYSIEYVRGSKVWYMIDLLPEVDYSEYSYVIKKYDLADIVSNLYVQYHQDLVVNNLSKIEEYYPLFIETKTYKQHNNKILQIIYSPKIIEISVIDFKPEADSNFVFTLQINAKMISFLLNKQGYILSGESKIQQYSEYWDIEITLEGKSLIREIRDTLATRIMEGDLQAKREFADHLEF